MNILTVKEMASTLRLSPQRIYELVSEGCLPHFRVGRAIRFTSNDLNEIINGTTERPMRKPR